MKNSGKLFRERTAAFIRTYLPVLFPRHCPICRKLVPFGEYIHPECRTELPLIKGPVCFRCGKPVSAPEQEYCYDCRIFPKSFQGGRALFLYNKRTRPLMAAFKYKNRRVLADFFAIEACRCYTDWFRNMGIEAIVPVPIHKNKQKKRGYNQAALLGSRLAYILNLSCYPDLLIRSADTLPQKQLSPQARLNNLRKAFRLNPRYDKMSDQGGSPSVIHRFPVHTAFPHKEMPDKLTTVLLVDDIYTTGATMEACTRILHEGGIPKVYVFSVCIGVSRD